MTNRSSYRKDVRDFRHVVRFKPDPVDLPASRAGESWRLVAFGPLFTLAVEIVQ